MKLVIIMLIPKSLKSCISDWKSIADGSILSGEITQFGGLSDNDQISTRFLAV